jgi:hypothetical protein
VFSVLEEKKTHCLLHRVCTQRESGWPLGKFRSSCLIIVVLIPVLVLVVLPIAISTHHTQKHEERCKNGDRRSDPISAVLFSQEQEQELGTGNHWKSLE